MRIQSKNSPKYLNLHCQKHNFLSILKTRHLVENYQLLVFPKFAALFLAPALHFGWMCVVGYVSMFILDIFTGNQYKNAD